MQQSCRIPAHEPRIVAGPALPRPRMIAIRTSGGSTIRPSPRRFQPFVPLAAKGGKSAAPKGFGAPKPTTKGVAADAPCPCGSGALYEACCSPYHRGGAPSVPSPEALLRSRYSAYVVKDPAYIAETTHPESSEYTGSRSSYVSAIKQTMRRVDPLGLTLVAQEPGATPDEAFITFRLKRRIKDPDVPGNKSEVEELTERSRFLRFKGRWFFLDSEFPGEEAGAAAPAAVTAAPAAAAPAQGQTPDTKKPGGFKLPFFS